MLSRQKNDTWYYFIILALDGSAFAFRLNLHESQKSCTIIEKKLQFERKMAAMYQLLF